ncbi:MAG: GAF domain-containing protein [Pseudomonadota bacterium]
MQNHSVLPAVEIKRLAALRRLKISDSPYESLFNTITRAISEICRTPIALISFIEEDRQWFKSNVGLNGITETPIEQAFCAHTILSEQVMEVKDATLDERFKNNPLVTGSPNIRFYAGAPITLPLGERIGSLCVIDTKANQLNECEKAALESFAKVISQTLLIRDVHSRKTLINS